MSKPKKAVKRPQPRSGRQDIEKVAQERLGFDSLRPGQEEAILSLLDGSDTLVVQPTGSGKSAIYQIASLLTEGVTLVVSPLIALQKDQVDAIQSLTKECAAVLNSTLSASETEDVWGKLSRKEIKFLFLAPEQLNKQETLQRLKTAGISLFVIDEAHCISEWGHDFRPDYLHLGSVIKALKHPRVLAMTATASESVRDEIRTRLAMRKPKVFVQGFDRPNISLRVDHFKTEADKRSAVAHRIRWADKPGIVYVATRRNAEEIMSDLKEEGVESLFYHGGMKAKDRDCIQERFMAGEAEVIVATNAFGMGIDKADVRFVYHFDIPDSLDSYYQEVGRAGRDGEKAEAILFYRAENLGMMRFRTGEAAVDEKQFTEIIEAVADEEVPVRTDEIAQETDLSSRKLTNLLHRLEDVGALEVLPLGEVRATEGVDPKEAARAAAQEQEERKEGKHQRLEQMREYANLSSCRREFLLRYFGDSYTGPCGSCDVCEAVAVSTETSGGTRREVTE